MELIEALGREVGPGVLLTEAAAMAPYLVDWRGLYCGPALCVARPRETAEAARIVCAAAARGVAIVPQGGNTGLAGGSVPLESGPSILLSLERMDRIRGIDAANYTMTVEAGCILQQVQAAAAAADRLFPLSLAAEGSCRIGGNLSTNAGGIAVLRYGNMRDLVLGLEVVLPDGRVWEGLRALRKDNTGYDLKQLFIGAEGTLGVITAAVLKLFPLPRQRITAFAGATNMAATLGVLSRLRDACGEALTSFEMIPRVALDLAIRHVPGSVDPLSARHDPYLLIELASSDPAVDLRTAAERALGEAMAAGLLADATIAASDAQARRLWHLREAIVEAQKPAGASIKHDVAVPVSAVPAFLAEAETAIAAAEPGVVVYAFGHLGDGNIHFNLIQPATMGAADFLARTAALNRVVHDVVARHGGSISAEHGLGQLRREEIRRYKPEIEIEMMRRIKSALDPQGIMNPGKLLPAAD
jgi:FAD/FMN-containing dehydrogenase